MRIFALLSIILSSSIALAVEVQETPPIPMCGLVQKAEKTIVATVGQEIRELRMDSYINPAFHNQLTAVDCACVCFTGTLTSELSLVVKSIIASTARYSRNNPLCRRVAYATGLCTNP